MKKTSGLTALLFLVIISGVAVAGGEKSSDWPQWRGPERDGKVSGTTLLKTWPAEGPKELWRVVLGEGYSGMAVSDGRLFTLFSQGEDEFVVCLDAASGKELWRHKSGPTFVHERNGSGPRSTPTVDGEMVYALGTKGRLMALNTKDGAVVWEHELLEQFETKGPSDGAYASSPLVEGDLLIVEVGGEGENAFVAFDKRTGEVRWKSQTDQAAFSAPIAVTVDGVRQIIFFTAAGMASVSPEDGHLYWRQPWETVPGVNAATPVFVPDDKLLITSGYDTGAALFQVKVAGKDVNAEEVWKNRALKSTFSSPVLYGRYVYGFDGGTMKCLEAETGEEMWKTRGLGHGSMVLADGHILALSDRGELALIEATPDGYKEKARAQALNGRSITSPALAAGRIYMRNMDEVVCLQVGEGSGT